MFSCLLRVAALLAISLPFAVSAADPAHCRAGVRGVRSRRIASALELFEGGAYGRGRRMVPYNIGVCQYKLGLYADANGNSRRSPSVFRAWPASPPTIAASRCSSSIAGTMRARRSRRRSTAATTRSPRWRPRDSRSSVSRGRPRVPSMWTGLFDASLGHDDNVALVDELTLPAGRSGDGSLLEVLAFATRSAGRPCRCA